jgi:hypothetical protein
MPQSTFYLKNKSHSSFHLFVLGNHGSQTRLIRTTHFVHLGSILEELKGGHSLDTTQGGHFFGFIDIDLDKFALRILSSHLFKDWTNEFTGPALEENKTKALERMSITNQWT